jgi:hypothetical protein
LKLAKSQLKQIIKEELSSVINERETDSTYAAILDLFNEAFLSPANLDIEDLDSTSQSFSMVQKTTVDRIPKSMRKALGRLGKYLTLRPDVIEEYAKRASEIPGIENLFTEASELEALFGTKVNFIYETEGSLGSSLGWFNTANGEVSLNFASPQIMRELRKYPTKHSFDKFTESDLVGFIVAGTNALPAVFEHEMTHMIDYHRGGGRDIPMDSGIPSKEFKDVLSRLAASRGEPQTPEEMALYRKIIKYANSTMEIQARITHIFKDLKKNIQNFQAGGEIKFQRPVNTNPLRASRKLMGIEFYYRRFARLVLRTKEPYVNQNIRKLVRILVSIYGQYYEGYTELTTDQNMKRIINRFYDFSKEMIEEFGAQEETQ